MPRMRADASTSRSTWSISGSGSRGTSRSRRTPAEGASSSVTAKWVRISPRPDIRRAGMPRESACGEEATIVGTRRRDARRRLPDLDLPRARSGARARHRPERRDGRAVRQGDRHLARPRRLDAPVRPRAAIHGRLRDRRRQPAARGRAGARVRLQGRGLGHACACSATAPPTRARSARR